MFKKLFLGVWLATMLLACEQHKSTTITVNGTEYVAGIDYKVLNTPIRFGESPLPNMIEIFWYGCPHCERFEPFLQDWIKTLPVNLEFGRLPAIWNDLMIIHAHAFFIAQQLELGHDFHMQLFTRVLASRSSQDLDFHRSRIASLFKSNGISENEFNDLYESEEIKSKVGLSFAVMKEAGISSTPTFLINGKYVLTGGPFKTREELLSVARHLMQDEIDHQPEDWW
ncbi:thiol:disulfide interchange protein DsbA/DsbL [Oceanicoccus sp. KOV_DT_Chl]|uniref:thiol:disulfide interchange protein DsbA/DsbL n=1 Tax=Oceanicoccus sp. KOV_DT_Chl TaxID=1904639 RepID=UPI000C7BBD36|nr:thiol:disulfide interchange protein DsbA/DsbL [Oceanicoccus sp. KOV_DT_Chl]